MVGGEKWIFLIMHDESPIDGGGQQTSKFL